MEDMDALNTDAITTLSGASVPRTVKTSKPTTPRKRIEAVQRMSVNEKRQGSEACRKNSHKITDLNFSSEHEHTINQDGTHCCTESHRDVDFHDRNRHEEASKTLLLSSHKPVTTDPNGLLANQLVTVNQDGQRRDGKRRKIRIKSSTKTSTVCEQENNDDLEAKIKDLKKDNAMNCSKLRHFSDTCLQLTEENDLLMDELKQWCTPETMLDLESSDIMLESTK